MLEAATLAHLDLHLAALDRGMTLSDASAYNVQFMGARPLFVDLLSLRRYREGEFWDGHSQFCNQFLNPLLLRALLGVPHNAWYRGALEGITTSELARLIPLRRKFSWNVFSQVVLQAKMQNLARGKSRSELAGAKQKQLPRAAFRNMLLQLRGWIDLGINWGSGAWPGVALFFRALAQDDLAIGRLVQPFDRAVDTGNHYFLNYPAGRELSAAGKTFRRWLLDERRCEPIR